MRRVTGKGGEGLRCDMWDCEETGDRGVIGTGIKGAAGGRGHAGTVRRVTEGTGRRVTEGTVRGHRRDCEESDRGDWERSVGGEQCGAAGHSGAMQGLWRGVTGDTLRGCGAQGDTEGTGARGVTGQAARGHRWDCKGGL